MRIDKIGTVAFDRANGTNQTLKVNKGGMNGIMVYATDFSVAYDSLSVKVKAKEGNQVLLNRMAIKKLVYISNLKNGYRSIGGIKSVIEALVDVENVDFDAKDDDIKVWMSAFGMNVFYLDLGSISTDLSEVEVSFEVKAGGAGVSSYHFYQVKNTDSPDRWLIYDETQDFTEKHTSVRNAFFWSAAQIITEEGIKNVDFQLDLPDDSQLFDSIGALAYTNLFNKVEASPESQMLEIYADKFPIPTDMRIKVMGQSGDDTLIVVREYIPRAVSNSTIASLKKLEDRTKALELKSQDEAKRYRHLGSTEKSETISSAVDKLESIAVSDGA